MKVHKIINDQTKNELLCIWTWIVIWNENSFNVSCQSVMILERWFDQQTSVIITTHDSWKWTRSVLCWLDQWHEMKHEIHMIWTSDQMKRIQIKNMRIIHNNKEKHINFDKRISWRSFFMIYLNWINKRRKSMIILWYMIHEMNHKHMIHKDRKSMKHCCPWTTYKHEHELDFDHSQNHIRNHDMKYEISEIFNVAENTVTELYSLAAWRSQWNSQLILDHNQEWTCEFWKSFLKQLEAIQKLCQWFQ